MHKSLHELIVPSTGIITEFEIQTKPRVDTYYSVVAYTPAQTPDLLEVYGEYLSDPSIDSKGSVEITFNGNITTAFYGWATSTSAPKDFDRFSKLPSAQTLIPPTNGSFVNVILQLGGSQTTLGNWVGLSFSHKVKDGKLMQETLVLIQEASKKLKPNMYLTYVPQGILPNVVKIGQANGGNYFGIEPTPQVCRYSLTPIIPRIPPQSSSIFIKSLSSLAAYHRPVRLTL